MVPKVLRLVWYGILERGMPARVLSSSSGCGSMSRNSPRVTSKRDANITKLNHEHSLQLRISNSDKYESPTQTSNSNLILVGIDIFHAEEDGHKIMKSRSYSV
ncbi:hypothetical protein AVEN_138288-1 [Araneus ventricosus]|uniref:Uncharacterized protein n=1 Tax=Araneus ventricosus TaxID=182803 RepID=A0A4Y2IT14_ARAVE|nr:hypothetical protein AVEN_138288-1 [Araneus ventricosus]